MKSEKIGASELFHGDCMELMARYPDGHFDLAIVDPPYGVGSITYMPCKRTPAVGGHLDEYNIVVATLDAKKSSSMTKKRMHKVEYGNSDKVIFGFGDENVNPPPEYFKELFRVSKNQIIWGGNYFMLPPSRCFIVWDKAISENFSMAMCEQAWTSFSGNAKIIRGIYADRNRSKSKEARIHPTQKPVELYRWLLANYAEPGDKILDTHLGSGSVAIACNGAGFELTASELDAEYYEAAVARVREHARQGKLGF